MEKSKTVKLNKIAFCDWDYEKRGKRVAELTRATVCLLSAQNRPQEFDTAGDFLQWCVNAGLSYVYVWNLHIFGMFLDWYACALGLEQYDREKHCTKRGRVCKPCWNGLYTSTGIMSIKITLERTAYTHNYRSGKLGGVHTVEFRGLRPLLSRGGVRDFNAFLKDFAIECKTTVQGGAALLEKYNTAYEDLTGIEFFNKSNMRRIYSIGGAAQMCYLRMRYGPKATLKSYQREHPQVKEDEMQFRKQKLLLGGMCIYQKSLKKKLIHGVIKKYDVNGLYTWAANEAGELGPPERSSWDEYQTDKSGEYEYILIFDYLEMYLKAHTSKVFENPFTATTSRLMTINEEYAIFGTLFEALKDFYNIEDFNVIDVIKCKKHPDPWIINYNIHFSIAKQAGENEGNKTKRTLAKLFLNALYGKFSQLTIYRKNLVCWDEELEEIAFLQGDIIDNWQRKHFDYIRGAYIYMLARVKVMKDINAAFTGTKWQSKHHFYTDTDSIITDIQLPREMCDPHKIGAYKVEEVYRDFAVVCQKTYYGFTWEGLHTITAAGWRKGELQRQIEEELGEVGAKEFFARLISGDKFFTEFWERCKGGALPVKEFQEFGKNSKYLKIMYGF